MEILLGLIGIALFFTPLVLALINTNKLNSISRRVQNLEFLFQRQTSELEELRRKRAPAEDASAQRKEVKQEEEDRGRPMSSESTRPAPQMPSPTQTTQKVHVPQAKISRTNKEWEALIGGKVLNRIGALALIIGVGFFLKYAFDNNWISETMRVLIGAAAGGGLLVAAARTRARGFEVFSQGLVGAGVSILYLCVYAAFNFYHLVPQAVAFGLMSAVTMITLWQALEYDALAVAILGWAGGFLTPIMLATEVPNEVGLFTYIALLDAVLLAIVLSKEKWIVLEPLTLLGTSLMYLIWYVDSYKPEALVPTVFFLTIFWILFLAVESVRVMRGVKSQIVVRNVVAIASPVLFLMGMYEIIDPQYHAWMGLITLAIGIPYFLLYAKARQAVQFSVNERNVLLAIAFLFTATAIQFEKFVTVTIWSAEALVALWVGARIWKIEKVIYAALIILALATVKLLFSSGALSFEPLEEFRLLMNLRALAFVVLSCATFFTALILRANDDKQRSVLAQSALYAACILGLVLATVETNDLFERWLLYLDGRPYMALAYKRELTLGLVWMAFSLALGWGGLKRNLTALMPVSLGSAVLAVCVGIFIGISFSPIEGHALILNYRVLTLVLLVLGLLVLLQVSQRQNMLVAWKQNVTGGIRLAVVTLILILLTGETRDYFEQQIERLATVEWTTLIGSQIQQLENLKQLSLSGVWLFYSILMMIAGLWRRARSLRLVSIGLFGFTILKIFAYDLSFLQTLYRIFSFIGLGVILLAVSYLYQKYKSIILEGEETK